MPRLVLTGFMATGKTEVGRLLACRLGRPFVDTDGLVETAARCSVAQIFAGDGEAYFRRLERAAVEEACAVPDAVIATGGGTLLDPDNRRRLVGAGPVVCLTASAEEIARRVGDVSSRPLLAGHNGDRLARIRSLLDERAPVYALATHTHAESDVTGLVADLAAKVPTTRTISTTAPLSGGGALSSNLTLTISADHRAVDGAAAADFLRTLRMLLEEPGMMLV